MMSILTCEWRKLAFANYIVPPEVLEKHLPPHTQLDYFNGDCFVSLVGFQFKNVEVAGVKVPLHTDFEEINLRFYVKRFDGQSWRKGTVFLSEIVDKPALGALANSLFNEDYSTLPTKQEVKKEEHELKVSYSWRPKDNWHSIMVKAASFASPIAENSETEFIIHRLWGYGKHKEEQANEYNIAHPVWETYRVNEYMIDVDFLQFGAEFSFLNGTTPHSVMLAEGSEIQVEGSSRIS